jgi:hypothetical protein
MSLEWHGDKVARKFAQRAEANVRRNVAALRCPVHHQSPSVLQVTMAGSRLTTQVAACCEEMLVQAQRAAALQ